MKRDPLAVLIVDDDVGDRRLVRRALSDSGLMFDLFEAPTLAQAEQHRGRMIDLVVLDNQLPDGEGIESINYIRDTFSEAAIIVATGSGDEEIAVRAMHGGAEDYIRKSRITGETLQRSALNAIRVTQLRRKSERQAEELKFFAHMLVHDFKAPMMNIRFLAEAADEDLGDLPIEETRASLQDIQKCAGRQLDLIEALKVHIGFAENATFEPHDMGDLATEVVHMLRPIVAERSASIEVEPMPEAHCNAPEIRQLLQNLISNAIKFCPDRPLIRVGVKKDGYSSVFTVTDNGVGIPKEYHTKIFQPFCRLQSQDKVPGTGLGLATCAKIVSRHKGKIWCEDASGGGLQICFTLGQATADEKPVLQPIEKDS